MTLVGEEDSGYCLGLRNPKPVAVWGVEGGEVAQGLCTRE